MHKVREATLKHLKNIGVTIKDIEDEDFVRYVINAKFHF